MIDREDAQRLLRLAETDLKAVRNMLDPERFEDPVFGFHAQQAVEKALKAWLSLRGVAYARTHDLRLLMNLLQTQGEAECETFAGLADLTDFAVQFRYDFPILPERLRRDELLATVEALLAHVERLLAITEAGA